MKQLNQLSVLSKRILSHKMYLLMLFSIIAFTSVYKILPEKSKSTDIRVDVFYEGDDSYSASLKQRLEASNSIYTFGEAPTSKALTDRVKSGNIECGIYIPKTFFSNYIKGTCQDSKIVIYTIPQTTLASSIIETVMSNILSITADKILTNTINMPEYNASFEELLSYYLEGDSIFTIESSTSGKYEFKDEVYTLNIPVFELSIVYIIFAALLGLLLFQKDFERKMYVSQSIAQTQLLKAFNILSAILPLLLVSTVSLMVAYGAGIRLIWLWLVALISFAATFLLSFIIRKSTLLTKVLPLVALISTITIFIIELI